MQEVIETTTTVVSTARQGDNTILFCIVGLGLLLMVVIIAAFAEPENSRKKKPDPKCAFCSDGTDGREIRCIRVENHGTSFVVENEQTIAKYCPVCGRKLTED